MAAQNPYDEVEQHRSVDAPSSIDVSESTPAASTQASAAKPTSTSPEAHLANDADLDAPTAGTAGSVELHPAGQLANGIAETPSANRLESQDAGGQADAQGLGGDDAAQQIATSFTDHAPTASVGTDGSVGSDTEAGKSDAAAARDAIPRYAVKKSSFKPVSVTKTFLAKTGSVSSPVRAGMEKGPASSSLSAAANGSLARPRLIAKVGGGSRLSPGGPAGANGRRGSESGPDPNQVWNRNRVSTTHATPKHLTDEELRQQYGIQLASRPVEVGEDNGAKWADIDDDEDDWAPETIEWNDGTKIDLSKVEIPPEPAPAPEPSPAQDSKGPEPARAPSTPLKPTTVGPNATVLKLGGAAQSRKDSSASKSSMEKPTLVAKPSSATAVKSPWAPLPAVEKVPPVGINPPVSQPPPGVQPPFFGQRDPHGFDAMPPRPSGPAQEMAADDFSRFSGDRISSGPRELFNSQSGRYEPVGDARRNSRQRDQGFRQPAVLQRPAPGDGPDWPRRRTSSTVSGESGKLARRLSVGKGFDPSHPSLDSAMEQNVDENAGEADLNASAQIPGGQAQHTLSGIPQGSGGPGMGQAGQPAEDVVAAQKRLMREKREAAIKRRQEEEAREEAEKKERIRLKMEKLGLGEDQRKKSDSPQPKAAAIVLPADGSKGKADANKPAQLLKDSPPTATMMPSPPKPPAPHASGQPQQYGLMKVHAPQTLSMASPGDGSHHAQRHSDRLPRASANHAPAPVTPRQLDAQDAAAIPPSRMPDAIDKHKSDAPPTWAPMQKQTSGGPSSAWSPAGNAGAAAGAPLWGPPAKTRALGNGDFQANLSGAQTRNAPPPPVHANLPLAAPQPIGTPRQNMPSQRAVAPGAFRDGFTHPTLDDLETISAFSADPAPTPLRPFGSIAAGDMLGSSMQPTHGHAAPETPEQPDSQSQSLAVAAWNNFGANAAKEDALHLRQAQEAAALRAHEAHLGSLPGIQQMPLVNETWKQVQVGGSNGSRQVVNSIVSQRELGDLGAKANVGPLPAIRSRYQDLFDQSQRTASSPSASRPLSPSGPPPDVTNHPAFVGIVHKPLVNLPGSRSLRDAVTDRPIVRLPPAKLAEEASVASQATIQLPRTPQGSISISELTNRINGLFDRRVAPEKRATDIADFSATKPSLDSPTLDRATPVSLPFKSAANTRYETRPKTFEDENALFDENRELGSVPSIHIPDRAPPLAWDPAPAPSITLQRKVRLLKDTDVMTMWTFLPQGRDGGRASSQPITVFLQGMQSARTKLLPRAPGSTPPQAHRAAPPTGRGRPRPPPKAAGESGSSTNQASPATAAVASPSPVQGEKASSRSNANGHTKPRGRGGHHGSGVPRKASVAAS